MTDAQPDDEATTFAEPAEPGAPTSRWERLRRRIVTPQAIYGTILVSSIIGTSEDGDRDIEIFFQTIGTVLVFWIAHVFADAIAHFGTKKAVGLPFGLSLRHGARNAAGLLYALVLPCFFLLLGAIGVMDEAVAYSVSLVLPVFLLGELGWLALADRGAPWWVKLLASWITGLLGVIVIILKIAFH